MLTLIENGAEPLHNGEEVLVDGHRARVFCPRFTTHVFRGLISVGYGGGELDRVSEDQVQLPYRS